MALVLAVAALLLFVSGQAIYLGVNEPNQPAFYFQMLAGDAVPIFVGLALAGLIGIGLTIYILIKYG